MADLDPVAYDSLPGAPQQADAPLRVTVYPRRAELRFVPVDHDPFADDGVAGAAKPFTPIPSSFQKRAASILSCETAYIRCMQARAGNPVWCNAARDACLKTGAPTIFPGGFVGQGG